MAEDVSRSLLVLVWDLSPTWWGKQSTNMNGSEVAQILMEHSSRFEVLSINGFLDSMMVFCNAYLMMKHTNDLCILCSTSSKSEFIYPNPEEIDNNPSQEEDSQRFLDGKYEHFTMVNNTIVSKVKSIVEETSTEDTSLSESPATLSGALSMALCHIKQAERDCPVGQSLKARILVIKGSNDVSSQYMATMNCIFAAQKNNITIDSCLLKSDSGFLQQASDITGGIYFKVTKMESLLQYLLWMFLPDTSMRESLVLPSAIHIDYRAACFCHRTLVDIGFVCSVCLSIYCQLVPRCHTCQTRFKLPSVAMARPKKKRKEKSNETAIGNV